MKTEFETKILDINVKLFKEKLKNLWAKYLGKKKQRRYVYDFNPIQPNKWIRLRQRWNDVELTIKEIKDNTITWTKELEVWVSSFDKMNKILKELGYIQKAYQENIRESYILDYVEIEIDSWPLIPTYIEIKGLSKEQVENTVKKLGFELSNTTSINTKEVYTKYWLDLHSIKDLRF